MFKRTRIILLAISYFVAIIIHFKLLVITSYYFVFHRF